MIENRRNIPAWKVKFWKFLYRSYRSNKGASSIFCNRITSLGYCVLVIFFLAVALRLGSGRNVLFALIAGLGASIVFSFLLVFFRKAKVNVKRIMPSRGTVGEALNYFLEVESKQFLPVSSMVLRELPDFKTPSENMFVYSVEPGEEERNAFDRLFIVYRWKWLTGSRLGFLSHDSEPVKVSSKGKVKLKMKLIPKRRGILDVSNLHALLPDPLLLFQRCVKVEQSEDSVLVLPKRYSIRNLEIFGESQNQAGGEAQSRQIGQSSDFVSLRGYRPGDPIKHVDWKSWAKTGEPVVREYEDIYFPRHGLVLDTGVHPMLHEHFEEAVSVAASFACSLDTDEGLLDLVMIQQNARVITVGKGVERLDYMMEVLACAEIETEPDWKSLTQQVLRMAPDFSGCLMVFADWSEERADLVNQSALLGGAIICLVVYSVKEEVEKLLKAHPCSVQVNLLKVGQIQSGLDRALG